MDSNNYEGSRLYAMRHSAAHVMAEAVLKLFPEGKLGIGQQGESQQDQSGQAPQGGKEDDQDPAGQGK